ncbi:MAG: hypothetical protein HGB11_11285 [Chlorobiales bacterium]|nr:hypothetical protein [Chlorobiales bacterium]
MNAPTDKSQCQGLGRKLVENTASYCPINAPAAVIMAMYVVMAERRGVDFAKLRGTPQNDVLKEVIARGTSIVPPEPSIKLVLDMVESASRGLLKEVKGKVSAVAVA